MFPFVKRSCYWSRNIFSRRYNGDERATLVCCTCGVPQYMHDHLVTLTMLEVQWLTWNGMRKIVSCHCLWKLWLVFYWGGNKQKPIIKLTWVDFVTKYLPAEYSQFTWTWRMIHRGTKITRDWSRVKVIARPLSSSVSSLLIAKEQQLSHVPKVMARHPVSFYLLRPPRSLHAVCYLYLSPMSLLFSIKPVYKKIFYLLHITSVLWTDHMLCTVLPDVQN